MAAPLERVEALFHEALTFPAAERPSFLQTACGDDLGLLRELESLLANAGKQTEAFDAAIQPTAVAALADAGDDYALVPGALLGPYRIERHLGSGGMGAVYLASDTRLGRRVALKVISRELSRTEQARARFVREARSAAALSHPNIAALYDVGEAGQLLWLVMELVEGHSLRPRISGAAGGEQFQAVALGIAAALAHAHARRIIHRDIKPENILITGDGEVKVIDFGLARAISGSEEGVSSVTAANSFIGTVAYAAPELLAGGAASARSDVYSLGVVLYELACARQPFAGLSGHALISAILTGGYRRCAESEPQVGPGISAVIDRCMDREPAQRFRDAGEVLAALRSAHAGSPTRVESAPPVLAVMDFKNVGGGPDSAWLGTGIAETLSADLGKLKSVRVASRTRVVDGLRRLRSEGEESAVAIQLGRELGARWAVTGAFQHVGDRIRVTAYLIDVRTGESLAADKVDGNWADLFDVQDRVVAALLKLLTIGFGTTDERRIIPPETRSLVAYEHYVRGRQELYQMTSESLTAAISNLERAVALDPDYAFAYSALGTAHALRYIRSTDPEDGMRASRYLERAVEIDPELAEPYPWLLNIRFRKNDIAGAMSAGKKALELQPDLPEAHYFNGAMFYMLPELQPGKLRESIEYVAESVRLQPKHHAGWLVLGASAAFLGKHAESMLVLKHAVALDDSEDLRYRFVGSRTLLATVQSRAGLWEVARDEHIRAIESLRDTSHVYTTCFQTLSTLGLGDIEQRRGNFADALTHYRRARRIITESRQVAGAPRLLVRVNAGLAAAYGATADTERARELIEEARTALDGPAAQPASAAFECSLAQLWLCIAVAEIRAGRLARAEECLQQTREMGWLDAPWLRSDPELQPVAATPTYEAFLQHLELGPEVHVPLPDSLGKI